MEHVPTILGVSNVIKIYRIHLISRYLHHVNYSSFADDLQLTIIVTLVWLSYPVDNSRL